MPILFYFLHSYHLNSHCIFYLDLFIWDSARKTTWSLVLLSPHKFALPPCCITDCMHESVLLVGFLQWHHIHSNFRVSGSVGPKFEMGDTRMHKTESTLILKTS